jgi:hypothetical protein
MEPERERLDRDGGRSSAVPAAVERDEVDGDGRDLEARQCSLVTVEHSEHSISVEPNLSGNPPQIGQRGTGLWFSSMQHEQGAFSHVSQNASWPFLLTAATTRPGAPVVELHAVAALTAAPEPRGTPCRRQPSPAQ